MLNANSIWAINIGTANINSVFFLPRRSEEMPARTGLKAALKERKAASRDCSRVVVGRDSGFSSGSRSFGRTGEAHEYEFPVENEMKFTVRQEVSLKTN